MTFSLRRKRQTTHRAAPAKLVRKITSALFAGLLVLSSVQAQSSNPEVILPRFVPAQPRTPSGVAPASYTEPMPAKVVQVVAQAPRGPDAAEEPYLRLRTELPGPQRLFMRDSESQFFDRIAQDMKKQRGGARAVFPDPVVLSKEPFRPRNFPHMVELVEPGYVCHGRLYFEQPNFERAGYDFGVLQPAMCLGVFYYDAFMFPYHYCTDLNNRMECTAGKCLPGDQSPLLFPRERFSVTGLVGQSGVMIGLGFLIP